VSLYSALAKPLLFRLDPEHAHDVTMAALRLPWVPALLSSYAPAGNPRLEQHAFGLTFSNPIGLAAGLDKQGAAVGAWSALGFGFAEIGTVTPRPQRGNPKPRLFRAPEYLALINRFGFNSEGAAQVARNLSRPERSVQTERPSRTVCRVGINIGKNKDTPNEQAVDDYLAAVDLVHPFADYFVVNVSSPNTAGLRLLQAMESLRPLVAAVVSRVRSASAHDIPVLVKVSPDMSEEDLLASADAAIDGGARGIVATNTTISRKGLREDDPLAAETGGLSGLPLRPAAEDACRALFRHLRGRVPIIGVGGIFTADHAYQRIRSGASLIQIYTGLIFEGPAIVSRIATGLAERLERDGFESIRDAVGVDVR
jgi:dihydroorotate dehydrogenase